MTASFYANLHKSAYVDTFAPDGGFAYNASVVGAPGEEIYDRKMKLIDDFYKEYGRDWYRNNG